MTLREQMFLSPSPDYIAHHGILGMHWGVRRSPSQLGHHTPKPRKLENGKTGDYKNDGETVKQTYGKGKTRLVQSRNGESSPNVGKSKLVQIAEYRDKKIAAKKRAQAREEAAKQKEKEAKAEEKAAVKAEKQRRKDLGKEGRLKEDYQKNGMSEEEAAAAASSKVKRDTAIKVGVAAASTALAAYGAYKIHKEGTDAIAQKGGELVGKILGAKDRAIDKAVSAKNEFKTAQAVAKQKAKLKDVLPARESAMKQAMDKYKAHPEMQASIADWVTRDNSASVRFGSKGNTLGDLEEYLARAWPSIVKRA